MLYFRHLFQGKLVKLGSCCLRVQYLPKFLDGVHNRATADETLPGLPSPLMELWYIVGNKNICWVTAGRHLKLSQTCANIWSFQVSPHGSCGNRREDTALWRRVQQLSKRH